MSTHKIRVTVNDYGVIGKRIVDAVVAQKDMGLVAAQIILMVVGAGDDRHKYRDVPFEGGGTS